MLTERELYFWMAGITGWTYKRHLELMTKYNSLTEMAGHLKEDSVFFTHALSPEVYFVACTSLDERIIKNAILALEAKHIEFITPADECFPKGVLNLSYDRPFILYYVGDKELFAQRGLAIVGTRRCTYYGIKTVEKFVDGLKGYPLTIVSGLADGIDTAAHSVALECGLSTIAVLGSGLSHVTPIANASLARKIVKAGGVVLSEFPPDFLGSRYSYPQRNRLIAALSDGVMIVEAGEKSGSLYTAEHAVEQGKDIFLIPGELGARNFKGIERLYRSGNGNFIFEPNDILDAFGMETSEKAPMRDVLQLDMISLKVLDSLDSVALNYDSLFEIAGLIPSQFASMLTNLEIMGLIEARGSVYYKK